MDGKQPYRALFGLGALATLVHVPRHLIPEGPSVGAWHLVTWNLPLVMYYLTGVFAYRRQPAHPAARRLLATGACLNAALALGLVLTVVTERSAARRRGLRLPAPAQRRRRAGLPAEGAGRGSRRAAAGAARRGRRSLGDRPAGG